MNVAKDVAGRSTCDRARVGAVLVNVHKRIISTGYNGAPEGELHCDDVGHLMMDGHCVRTIHAEANAIGFAGYERAYGGTLYTTHFPCVHCANLIRNARIATVIFLEAYRASGIAMAILSPRVQILKYTPRVLDK